MRTAGPEQPPTPAPTSLAEIVLAGPRGFCAGVERAIEIVERALEVVGVPIYVRREIVHNRHVVEALREKGAVFVDELDEVPEGATVIFSAHGVSPAVREAATTRRLRVIDATCPLVTKVHLEAIRYAKEGRTIVLVGHADHDEVIGTLGRGASPHRGHRLGRGGGAAGRRGPREGRLPDADDAVGGRHEGGHRGAPPPVPRASSGRRATTSATRRRTGRPRSSSSPTTSTWCWCSARRTARTRTGCARSPRRWARARGSSTTCATSGRSGWTGARAWA